MTRDVLPRQRCPRPALINLWLGHRQTPPHRQAILFILAIRVLDPMWARRVGKQ